jgi:hypothetical protein
MSDNTEELFQTLVTCRAKPYIANVRVQGVACRIVVKRVCFPSM